MRSSTPYRSWLSTTMGRAIRRTRQPECLRQPSLGMIQSVTVESESATTAKVTVVVSGAGRRPSRRRLYALPGKA